MKVTRNCGLMSRYTSSLINHTLPDLSQFTHKLNMENHDLGNLEGKVVLLQFWTFGCHNCINTIPYVKEWYSELVDHNIEFVTIHTPEFGYEKDEENVRKALEKYGIKYPVLIDNEYKLWKSFNNKWWPHFFLIDKQRIVRYNFVGEGNYDTIRRLLLELNEES